jgi:hypothetical protein
MAANSDPASAADMRNTNYNLLLDDAMPDKLQILNKNPL